MTVAPLEPPNRYGAGTRVSSGMSPTALGAFAYRSEARIADGDPVESTLRVVARLPKAWGYTRLASMAATVDLGTDEKIRELPPRAEPLLTPLLEVLQAVNRIRIEYGADPIYELPKAEPAWKPASTCVLQRAFADLGVAVVDYHCAYGKGIAIEHGLANFIRDFDAGKYPELLERSS